jgi:predicted MPP superfamily phosphohydrolase
MIFFIIAVVIALLDYLTVKGLAVAFPTFGFRHKRSIRPVFIGQTAVSVAVVLCGFFSKEIRDYRIFALYYYLFGFVLAVYVSKSWFVFFSAIDGFTACLRKRKGRKQQLPSGQSRHIATKVGLITSPFYLLLIIWGIFFGRYAYEIETVDIKFEHLPDAFDGFKIVQISDVHAGSSFGTVNRFRKVVDIVNGQEPDIIVFTGDMVNNFVEEAYPFIPIFSELSAKEGKYAVLGNHDYGGYYNWKAVEDEEKNLRDLENAISEMGFTIMNNGAVTLVRDSTDRIALIGVENWGIKSRHPKKGDIGKAMETVHDTPFKILLSHDPSYWTEAVAEKTDIALTLSGHTHGMQAGIKIGKKRYSPAAMQYKYWAGLYEIKGRYLYVNRGLGVIGYPGRIGMSPEISVINLHTR